MIAGTIMHLKYGSTAPEHRLPRCSYREGTRKLSERFSGRGARKKSSKWGEGGGRGVRLEVEGGRGDISCYEI